MTSNRTIKTSIKRSLIVATALAGMAFANPVHADDAAKIASAAQTAPAPTAEAKRSEQSFDLKDHGDRFKLAIEAIRKNNRKPDWTWEEGENNRVAKTK